MSKAEELIQEWNEYVESKGHILWEPEYIADAMAKELQRLIKKCDEQAMVLQHTIPEKFPGVYFITGESGEKDVNGLPENIYIVPTYGSDYVVTYTKKARIAQ